MVVMTATLRPLLWAFFVGIVAAMLRLSGFSDLIASIRRGRDISVSAYTLGDPLVSALESRAESGAHVTVTLEEDPSARNSDQLRRHNAHLAAALRSHGVDARLERNVHSKTVVVDQAVFFDGSNWRDGDVILRGDAQDATHVASLKSAALNDESAMLESAREQKLPGTIVETETFSRFNVVSKALREMVENGLSPRLLVDENALRHNDKEEASLAWIAARGVDVRVCADTEKFALAGTSAWLGSANATGAWKGHDMTDWGVVTEDSAIVAAVRDRLEARWANARQFLPQGKVTTADNQ